MWKSYSVGFIQLWLDGNSCCSSNPTRVGSDKTSRQGQQSLRSCGKFDLQSLSRCLLVPPAELCLVRSDTLPNNNSTLHHNSFRPLYLAQWIEPKKPNKNHQTRLTGAKRARRPQEVNALLYFTTNRINVCTQRPQRGRGTGSGKLV